MSIIRDVVEVFKDISDYDEVEILKNKPKGSLTRMTKDAVLQFPVIASNSLDIQLIGLVNKALERNFTTLLKIAFSLNSITDEKDLIDYIRKFHQNTGLSDREYTSNLIVNKLVNECKIEYKFTDEKLSESDKASIVHNLTKDNHRLLREYLNELNLDKLNDKMFFINEADNTRKRRNPRDYTYSGEIDGDAVSKDVANAINRANKALDDAERNKQIMASLNKQSKRMISSFKDNNKNLYAAQGKAQGAQNTAQHALKAAASLNKKVDDRLSKINDKINDLRFKPVDKEPIRPTSFNIGGNRGAAFTTADVTKANEIMPLPLEVKVYVEDGEGNIIERNFMIGVKAVIHPVSSEYMIDSMMDGYRRGKFFFNFIKATTGEIKFFRDFVFMVDNIKTDAIKNATGNTNKWFSFLKRRALLAKFKNTLRMKNQLLPNTSIVLSGEEADTLKQQGVDILDPNVARDLMSHYFLLSIVVVDPALEIVHIIYDGEENYSSMSVMALNREAKEDNNSKQILSLLKSRPQF